VFKYIIFDSVPVLKWHLVNIALFLDNQTSTLSVWCKKPTNDQHGGDVESDK